MISPDAIFLNWLLALPFFAALCAAIFPRFSLRPHSEAEAESLPRAPFSLGALACLMGAVIAASLLPYVQGEQAVGADYWWTRDLYQLRFRADALVTPGVLLLYLLGFLANLHYYSLPTPSVPHRQAAFLLLLIGAASAALLSADLIAIAFFLQLALVSAWLLAGTEAPQDGDRMLKLAFAGALLALAGSLLMWQHASDTATPGLSLALLGAAPGTLWRIALAVLLGMTPLLAAVPGHFWLLPLARSAPRVTLSVGAMLALTGFLLALRLLPGVLLLPAVPGFGQLALALGLLSLLVAVLGAWVGRSLRELAGWLAVAQAGLFLLALAVASGETASPTSLALRAAVIHALATPLGLVALWSAVGSVLRRAGTDKLPGLSGLFAGGMPLAGIAFLAGGLSLTGVPPLPGFWAQRLLVLGMLAANRRGLVLLLILADVALLALVLGGFRRVFLREQPPPLAPPRRWEAAQLVLAAAAVAVLAAMAGTLNQWSGSVVGNLLTLSH